MANPWDPTPFPVVGDSSDEALFVWLGAIINQWERVEFELSRTYSLFAGDPTWGKCQEYGIGRIFRDRISHLTQKANTHFISNPSQDVEGHFNEIVCKAIGFADRRNEFAHAIAMNVENIEFFQQNMPDMDISRPNILLIPPYYMARKHGDDGFPEFAYSSNELKFLGAKLLEFELAINDFNQTFRDAMP